MSHFYLAESWEAYERKEKGLLVALRSFLDLSTRYPKEKFYIQIYRPRGFGENEIKYVKDKITANKSLALKDQEK